MRVLVRVTPGVAPTHDYIQTGQQDSKFGFGLARRSPGGPSRRCARRRTWSSSACTRTSARRSSSSTSTAAAAVLLAIDLVAAAGGVDLGIFNIGGGLGIRYTREDRPPTIEEFAEVAVEAVARGGRASGGRCRGCSSSRGGASPARRASPLYRVGTVKVIPGVRTYVAVDGGMSDNLRPMLYDSKYEAMLANKADEEPATDVRLAGKHCESGDVLVRDVHIAPPERGRRPGLPPGTGAYGYAWPTTTTRCRARPWCWCGGGDARVITSERPGTTCCASRLLVRETPRRGGRGPDRAPRVRHRRVRRGQDAQGERRRHQAGRRAPLELGPVLVRDLDSAAPGARPRAADHRPGEVLEDPEVAVVVELIGGMEPALDFQPRALKAGKNVVTANKQLLAQHGAELLPRRRRPAPPLRGRAVGAVPVIKVLRESLVAAEVDRRVRHRQRHDQLHAQRDGRDRR